MVGGVDVDIAMEVKPVNIMEGEMGWETIYVV